MLPFSIAAILAVSIHVSWAIGVALEHVPACVTYVEGCTSISRASRNEPQIFLYRAAITTSGVLLVPFWRINGAWHELLAPAQDRLLRQSFVALGVLAGAGLVANAAIIGTDIDWARTLRRICVIVFFFGSTFAMALSSLSLLRCTSGSPRLRRYARVQSGLVTTILLIGVYNYVALAVSATLHAHKSEAENIIEWWWVALLCAFLATTGLAWRASRLSAHWTASS